MKKEEFRDGMSEEKSCGGSQAELSKAVSFTILNLVIEYVGGVSIYTMISWHVGPLEQ